MHFYSINKIKRKQKDYFTVWYSADGEGFLTENGKLSVFGSKKDAADCIRTLSGFSDPVREKYYNLDELERNLSKNDYIPSLDNAAEYWSVFADLARSVGKSFAGDGKSFILNDIYDKLIMAETDTEDFYDNADEDSFDLTDEEEELTSAVLKSGIELFDLAVGDIN